VPPSEFKQKTREKKREMAGLAGDFAAAQLAARDFLSD